MESQKHTPRFPYAMGVLQIEDSKFELLRNYLASKGAKFEDRPHQVFLARLPNVVVNLYNSGKIVLGGNASAQAQFEAEVTALLNATPVEKKAKELPELNITGTRIGMDEVGKGDYFGPLIACAVMVTESQAERLRDLGVRDSKTLSDTTISNLAVKINRILVPQQIRIVPISPVKYNIRYEEMGHNVNRVLGWAHARALEDVLAFKERCELAIADQFGDESYIVNALMARGQHIELRQTPKAEREISVATASVLARDALLKSFLELHQEYGQPFPRGASNVEEFAKDLTKRYGAGVLLATAKAHFATTARVLGEHPLDLSGLVSHQRMTTSPAQTERLFLEVFSLISSFEIDLRDFIEQKLREYYGDAWWTKGVEENIRSKAEKLQRQENEKGRDARAVDCLEFSHYEYILNSKENWTPVFQPVFNNANLMLAKLRALAELRNPVAHSRSYRRDDKMAALASISWLREKMNARV